MQAANFCVQCGERLARKGWRVRLRGNRCTDCAQRFGAFGPLRPLIVLAVIALAGFAVGRYMQPAPPPLIIQRAANSPLSDAAVNPDESRRSAKPLASNTNVELPAADEAVYICGARTQKGTPCRRRVHAAGERCFQHKGMPSLVPLSKLVIRP